MREQLLFLSNAQTMKKQYLWGAVVVAALIAFWAIQQKDGSIKKLVDNLNLGPLTLVSSSPTPSISTSATPKSSVKATPKATVSAGTYGQLVDQYVGKRIQFDQYCQANPRSATFKNDTTIMLDNRSGDARIVTVGGVQHSLGGYGYKLVTVSSAVLPKTLNLNCGAAVNVGQILLQK